MKHSEVGKFGRDPSRAVREAFTETADEDQADMQEGISRRVWTPDGINVTGYLQTQDGLGLVARGYVHALRRLGIRFALNDLSTMNPNQTSSHLIPHFAGDYDYPFNANLICVNADQHFEVMKFVGPEFFSGRYNIGVWFWEVPEFPSQWHDRFVDYSEIWAATSFIADSVAASSPVPVIRIPPPFIAEAAGSRARGRRRLNVANETVFQYTFNFRSNFERKNPMAAIKAFKAAFNPTEPVRLIMKCVNGSSDPENYEAMVALAEGHPISVYGEYWSEEEMRDLSAATDVYVSLHRSEGLGLTILDAMSLGKPVIATNWSGNADFMHPGNSFPVHHELIEIAKDSGPYTAGTIWADPSIDHAAELMRYVHENRDESVARGNVAAQDIATNYSVETAARTIGQRLGSLTGRGIVTSGRANHHREGTSTMQSAHIAELGDHFDNGIPTNEILFRLYADLDPGERARFGDPQRTAGPDSFFEWATAPRPDDGYLSRFLVAVYERRPDVAATFPDPGELDRPAFLQWARTSGAAELYFDPRLVPTESLTDQLRERIRDVVEAILHRDARVLVITGGDDELLRLGDRWTRPFSPTSELGAGSPDSGEVVTQLEALRGAGAEYLLISGLAFRNAFSIAGLREQLERIHLIVWNTPHCIIYQLVAEDERHTLRNLPIINERLYEHDRASRHLRNFAKQAVGMQARLSEIDTRLSTLAAQLLGPGGQFENLVQEFGKARAEVANVNYMFAARPYMAVDSFGTNGDLDRPMGYDVDDPGQARPLHFSDVFRGSEEFIKERQRAYLPLVKGMGSVLDLGCGRGEFLQLLRDAQIPAIGIELDEGLVTKCRSEGLEVFKADAFEYLQEQQSGSLDVIFSAQVVEHVDPDRRTELLELARDRLRVGGLFIAETVNPECFEAFKTFPVDPTHRMPIFPQVLLFECREAGYRSAKIFYPTAGGFTQRNYQTAGEYAVVAVA